MQADSAARLLLVAGRPLKELIARQGPFVMNTQQEIRQAFLDYKSGRFWARLILIEYAKVIRIPHGVSSGTRCA